MKYPVRSIAGAAIVLAAGLSPVTAEWTSVHRDATNIAVVPIAAAIPQLPAHPPILSAEGGLIAGARPVLADGRLVVPVLTDDDGDGEDDSLRLRAVDARSLAVVWQSEPLDAGFSLNNGSVTSATIDQPNGRVYYATGSTVYAVSWQSGAVLWGTALNATTTAPGRAYGITNSSPTAGDGQVYIQATAFLGSTSQVVALDAATGAVAWSAATSGWGVISPLHLAGEPGTGGSVVVDTLAMGGAGLAAHDALTGELLWDHATLPEPWFLTGGSFLGVWIEPVVLGGGDLLVGSYDFTGGGTLARVDPITGAARWVAPAIAIDSPPIVIGGVAYLLGGPFGAASLNAYDLDGGAQLSTTPLGRSVFRTYMAATNDVIYVPGSAGMTSYSVAGAAVLGTSGGAIDVPVVANDGSIYAGRQGRLARYAAPLQVGEPPVDPPALPGDVDGNGVVDNVDAVRIMEVFLGLAPVPANLNEYNINGDSVVDFVDAILVFRSFLGLAEE